MAGEKPQRQETLTRALRHSMMSDFGRYLAEHGFERYKAGDSSGLDYFFRRQVGDYWNLVQIQFDKRHRPKFILEFGKFPVGGIVDRYGRHVADDEARCYMLPERGRLYRSRALFFWVWFGVSAFAEKIFGREAAIAAEIRRLMMGFSQVEQWFGSGAVGSCINVEVLGNRRPATDTPVD